MTSASVLQHLSADQKAELGRKLASSLNDDSAEALVELVPHLDPEVLDNVLGEIQKYVENAASGGNPQQILKFLSVPGALDTAINKCIEKLKNIRTNKDNCNTTDPDLDQVFRLFATVLPRSDPRSLLPCDSHLCALLERGDSVSNSACESLRWRMNLILEVHSEQFWLALFSSLLHNESSHSVIYITWLRALGTSHDFQNDQFFQHSVITKEAYWVSIQNGLGSTLHEIRKYSLAILQLSVGYINSEISTTIFSWNVLSSRELLREWTRYSTLFEVLGIDTSLHQTKAAQYDMVQLILGKSVLHPSWGLCLLSTGFLLSMDSVRKHSLKILLSLSPDSLGVMTHGLKYLEEAFLPYMALARHFAVHDADIGGAQTGVSDFGNLFRLFISGIIRHSTEPQASDICLVILRFVGTQREMFGAVKYYFLSAMVEGLSHHEIILQSLSHGEYILRLFGHTGEGELYTKVLLNLILKLAMMVRYQDLSSFSQMAAQFARLNRSLYEEKHQILKDFAERQFDEGSAKQFALDETIMPEERLVVADLLWLTFSSTDSYIAVCSINYPRLSTLHSSARSLITSPETLSEDCFDVLALVPSSQLRILADIIDVEKWWTKFSVVAIPPNALTFLNNVFEISPTRMPPPHEVEKLVSSLETSSAFPGAEKFPKKQLWMCHAELLRLCSLYDTPNLNVVASRTSGFRNDSAVALRSTCRLIMRAFDLGKSETSLLCEALVGLMEAFAELDRKRLKLTERTLHLEIITTLVNLNSFQLAKYNDDLCNSLEEFCLRVVCSSKGRRSLLPTLSRQLWSIQRLLPDVFESISFIPNLLLRLVTFQQLHHSAFRIEQLVASDFDQFYDAGGATYRDIYGDDEAAARIYAFAIFTNFELAGFAHNVLQCAFDDNHHIDIVTNAADGHEEFQRSQIAKAVVAVIPAEEAEQKKAWLSRIMTMAIVEPSPLVRSYLEWAAALILTSDEYLVETVLKEFIASIETSSLRPSVVVVYERILYLVLRASSTSQKLQWSPEFVSAAVAAATSNKAAIRHFSSAVMLAILDDVKLGEWNVSQAELAMLLTIAKVAKSGDPDGAHRSGSSLFWNIRSDFTLVNISGGLHVRLEDREVEYFSPKAFTDYLPEASYLKVPIGKAARLFRQKTPRALQLPNTVNSLPLQTKSGAWNTLLEANDNLTAIKRSDLIVVASLVDKPPNLGGICRLCDVLGAGTLTLNDLKVKQNKEFKAVAVTADLWMPMIEVKEQGIALYLREKKREGYTLFGLEQTDHSVILDGQTKFPLKSLILLGKEKEGVPGELLAELDTCVEIKQVGVVRSMNIQTATAVVVHAYSSQNC